MEDSELLARYLSGEALWSIHDIKHQHAIIETKISTAQINPPTDFAGARAGAS